MEKEYYDSYGHRINPPGWNEKVHDMFVEERKSMNAAIHEKSIIENKKEKWIATLKFINTYEELRSLKNLVYYLDYEVASQKRLTNKRDNSENIFCVILKFLGTYEEMTFIKKLLEDEKVSYDIVKQVKVKR